MGYFLGQHNPSNYFALTIDSAGDLYGDDDDLSRDEYIERDKRVLLYMKKHPEIRKIVEEQIGEPITSIWKDAEV